MIYFSAAAENIAKTRQKYEYMIKYNKMQRFFFCAQLRKIFQLCKYELLYIKYFLWAFEGK